MRRRRWLAFVLALLVLAGIALLVDLVLLGGPGAPSYKVTPSVHPNSVGSSSVYVGFGVKNTGSATGTPVCTVRVTTPTGRLLGKGRFTEKPLDPGKGAIDVEPVKVAQTPGHPVTREYMEVQVTCT